MSETSEAENRMPAALGYRWPAEWELHAATWLSWPHNRETWPGAFEPIPERFATFVRVLSRFETVHINAGGESVMAEAKRLVGGLPNVVLHDFPTNDAWCRDHGPIFVRHTGDQPTAIIDWEFNSWGEKYQYNLDNQIPQRIAEWKNCRRFRPKLVLEGGSIDGNGNGTLVTTEQCLLNPNRNADVSREQLEKVLGDYLGTQQVIWLRGGKLTGDDTDGHVDQLARFVRTDTIACAVEENPRDENYDSLQANFDQLRTTKLYDGRSLNVVALPMPTSVYHQGNPNLRMPASYCNFYIANGVVIVPQFDAPQDGIACDILAKLFPDRVVIGLPARELVWGLGAFHCLSQQEPA